MSVDIRTVRCACGQVVLEARGSPIVSTVCDCPDCRRAGHILEARSGAAPILDEGGGVAYSLFRKDRVRCARGCDNLREHRLRPDSPTRRVVATCCNSFMFADFTRGHWISIARDRLGADAGLEMVPEKARKSAGFALRLGAAWVGMRFRIPRIDYVRGDLDDR